MKFWGNYLLSKTMMIYHVWLSSSWPMERRMDIFMRLTIHFVSTISFRILFQLSAQDWQANRNLYLYKHVKDRELTRVLWWSAADIEGVMQNGEFNCSKAMQYSIFYNWDIIWCDLFECNHTIFSFRITEESVQYCIPNYADILVFQATYEGQYAFR